MTRLQKLLSQQGVLSRRLAEQLIKANKITINNKTAKLGDCATVADKIIINNKTIKFKNINNNNKNLILLYHKPKGQICTTKDPANRPTVFQHLPRAPFGSWISIGRLDLDTSGILLFTNNGELANQLMHPKAQIEREYLVRIHGNLTQENIYTLIKGIKLKPENKVFKFNSIIKHNLWYKIILTTGKNREIKRLLQAIGLQVTRLIRIRFGEYILPKTLKPGSYIIHNH